MFKKKSQVEKMISESAEMAEALGPDAQLCVIEKKTSDEYGIFETQTFEFGVRRPYYKKWFMGKHALSIILSWWNQEELDKVHNELLAHGLEFIPRGAEDPDGLIGVWL